MSTEPSLITIPTSRWRVKLYQLENRSWKDTGTGYCWGDIDDGTPLIVVESENSPDDMILRSQIKGPILYQKQDTLIIWNQEVDGQQAELALSFQEVTGCVILCEFLVHIHSNIDSEVAINVIQSSSEAAESLTRSASLPPVPTHKNLELVLSRIKACSQSVYGRDSLSVYFLQSDYLPSMISLFNTLEANKDADVAAFTADERLIALQNLCEVAKALFGMGENLFIDMLLEDAYFVSFLGILEYDKEFGKRKANYRRYFETKVTFKEVLPIEDAVMEKIRKTFRLSLLKDVVLARLLDDTLFGILSSLILMSHMEIIAWLQANQDFMKQFFGLFENTSSPTDVKDDAVRFMSHILTQSKVFQQQRLSLYLSLIEYGLLRVLVYGLKRNSKELKSSSLECVKLLLDTEINVIDTSKPLMCALLDVCKQDDVSLQLQACETLKTMLEPPINAGFEKTFYESCAEEIFADLASPNFAIDYDPEVIVDFLSFCLKHHRSSSDKLLSELGLWDVLSKLLAPPKRNKLSSGALLACVRCLKYMVLGSTAEDITKIIESNALGNTLDLVEKMGNVNTLLHSSCLDLLRSVCVEQPDKTNVLREWLKINRIEQLSKLVYIPSIRELLQEDDETTTTEPDVFTLSGHKRTSSSVVCDSSSQKFRAEEVKPGELGADDIAPGPGTPRPKKPIKRGFSTTGQPAKRMVSFEQDSD